eukprot:s504_g20.t1
MRSAAEAPPHVTHTNITSLRLSWMHPHNGGSELTNFWLRWWETDAAGRPESIRDCGEMMVKGKRRFILVDGLQARRTYQFQLAAENKMGLGQYSEPSKPAKTLDPALPLAPGKPIGVRCSFNTITMLWTPSESVGAECTAQVVQISNDPTFPPKLTGQAWLPPYQHKRRRDITADIVFRTPQAFLVGPEKRPGWQDDQVASLVPERASIKYGNVRLSRSDFTPPEELVESGDEQAMINAWHKQAFESIFAAETTARISSAVVEARVKEQMEIMGYAKSRFSEYPAFKEAMTKTLTQEELEEKRATIRRGVYTGEKGFKSLAEQMQSEQEPKTPPSNTNKYNLVGMQPGTYYYARVASVNEMGLSPWSPLSLPSPSGAYTPAEIPQDPGIELLRVGCTSLSFGWKRPYCGGAPVTHYVIRFAESEAALQNEDCYEFSLDETEIETWHGYPRGQHWDGAQTHSPTRLGLLAQVRRPRVFVAMVIKTDLCSYTEYRIYPGHGQKFVAKDAKVSFFINAKADSLFHQRIKPVKLRWTQAWRRMNKKGKVEEGGKKKARKAQKFQKAIVGMSLDDIKKKKAQRPELRAQREKEAKEAKAKAASQKKTAAKPAVPKTKAKADKGPKMPKGGGAGGGGKNFKGKKCLGSSPLGADWII